MSDKSRVGSNRETLRVGGWGYNEGHPDRFHAVLDDEEHAGRSACGMMTGLFDDGTRGSFDWFREVESLKRTETWWSIPCFQCIKTGAFDGFGDGYDALYQEADGEKADQLLRERADV